jgi:hypothetical protein
LNPQKTAHFFSCLPPCEEEEHNDFVKNQLSTSYYTRSVAFFIFYLVIGNLILRFVIQSNMQANQPSSEKEAFIIRSTHMNIPFEPVLNHWKRRKQEKEGTHATH